MRRVKLTRPRSLLAPFHQVFAGLVELHDARDGVLVAIRHEDIAVGRRDHGARAVERLFGQTRDAGLPEPHHDLSVRAELDDLLAFAFGAAGVSHPYETFF